MASSSSSSPEISSQEPWAQFSYKDATEEDVLDDLSSRFILNLPDEELASLERLCFQVEQAHWFYEDFIREENTNLPSYNLKRFSEMLFKACPLLQQWSDDHEKAFSTFMQYKTRVPVCGAIMLNEAMDKCVLVKGWKASSGWGFPKGKINEDERPRDCAVREVLEETGYNLASQINADDYFEMSIKEQKIALFVVPGVPEDFPFKTKTRKEISKIEWFKLTDLPTWKRNKAAPGRFYLISPFITPLKKFINQRKPRNPPRKNGKQKNPQLTIVSKIDEAPPDHTALQDFASPTDGIIAKRPISNKQPEATLAEVQNNPLLARLFIPLVKSATGPTESNDPESEKKYPSSGASERSRTPPQPISNSVTARLQKPSVVPQISEQSDWSSSTPSYSQNADAIGRSDLTRTPVVKESPLLPSVPPSSTPLSNHNHNNTSQILTVTNHTTTSLPSATSPTSPTSPRKATSTADISPYLSRQKEIPTSAKMLQQLSLLESVADESARMAPIIAARAAMVSRGPMPGGYPNPSTSVPPQPIPSRESIGLYSFPPGPPASAAGFHPRYPVDNLMNNLQDPFQVRSRTSQAFHRGPMHHPTSSFGLNQNHLLASINGSRGGPISPNYQIAPQFMHQQHPQPQLFNQTSQFYNAPDPVQYQPIPVPLNGYNNYPSVLPPLPPPPMPTTARPYSTVHPNLSPSMTMVPPNASNPTSVSLLSILNGRSTQQQTTVPAPIHQ